MKKTNLIFMAIVVFSVCCNAENFLVESYDVQLISYNVYGKGDITLVFVHGWSCDSRYWKYQVSEFAKKYKVVTIDLAGYGNSEQNRKIYTLEAFGQDVKAVVEDVNAEKAILIGHSMSGEIVAEAARLMPDRAIGIIGADSIQNVEATMPEDMFKQMVDGFEKDFKGEVEKFVGTMLGSNIKPELKKWIIDDMSCEPPNVAISTFKEYVMKFKNKGIAKIFKEVKVPVRCVNADLWPTDAETNRRYMSSFEAAIIKDCGHFVMLEKPKEFNKNLEKYIKEIVRIRNERK